MLLADRMTVCSGTYIGTTTLNFPTAGPSDVTYVPPEDSRLPPPNTLRSAMVSQEF